MSMAYPCHSPSSFIKDNEVLSHGYHLHIHKEMNGGSYISVYALLNLLSKLGKRGKCEACQAINCFFCNKFN